MEFQEPTQAWQMLKIDHLETLVQRYEDTLNDQDTALCKINQHLATVFSIRKQRLLNTTTSHFLKEHYEEQLMDVGGEIEHGGLGFDQCQVIDWIHWMSYSDKDKQQFLDDDLDDFISNNTIPTDLPL